MSRTLVRQGCDERTRSEYVRKVLNTTWLSIKLRPIYRGQQLGLARDGAYLTWCCPARFTMSISCMLFKGNLCVGTTRLADDVSRVLFAILDYAAPLSFTLLLV